MSDTSAAMGSPDGWRPRLKGAARLLRAAPVAAVARLRAPTARPPRFAGAYDSREQAVAAAARLGDVGYDHEALADVSFARMCRTAAWDYPVLFWLDRWLRESRSLLDAGGHMGTKFIAFSRLLDLSRTNWTVYDLPAIIRTARARQTAGELPAEIGFIDRLDAVETPDILLGSGLLQYLDVPFADLIAQFPRPPRFILINKVAVREGPTLFTLERIGTARVPYRIRNRRDWLNDISALGYEIADSWTIPELAHVIPTHPWLGQSQSCGYALRRAEG